MTRVQLELPVGALNMPEQTILRPPYDQELMPIAMRRLEVNNKGYPIPWFVDRNAPLKDGSPDFRIMDGKRFKLALRENRCWICGGKIMSGLYTFVAGPMCGINRTSSEPPCHSDCAVWAARACPFLAVPKRIRDNVNMPKKYMQAGVGLQRNPGVVMLWITDEYKTFQPKIDEGLLIEMGKPTIVHWLCEGRAATRKEIEHSIETGIPFLLEVATKKGPVACVELGRYIERFLVYLPPEEPEQAERIMF
jgi:hypothetical protein